MLSLAKDKPVFVVINKKTGYVLPKLYDNRTNAKIATRHNVVNPTNFAVAEVSDMVFSTAVHINSETNRWENLD